MQPIDHFIHCPRCGTPRVGRTVNPFQCAACGFVFYFNPTVAAAAIVFRPDGQVLFIERAKEPAKGKLAFPGGFIDIGETVEAALRRETREEVGIEIHDLQLICSHPNEYLYKDVRYPVLDFIFSARTQSDAQPKALDAVAGVFWLDPKEVALEDLAFPSLREGLAIIRRSA